MGLGLRSFGWPGRRWAEGPGPASDPARRQAAEDPGPTPRWKRLKIARWATAESSLGPSIECHLQAEPAYSSRSSESIGLPVRVSPERRPGRLRFKHDRDS